jgi:hypothetical protein
VPDRINWEGIARGSPVIVVGDVVRQSDVWARRAGAERRAGVSPAMGAVG